MSSIAKTIIAAYFVVPALIDIFFDPILSINYVLLLLYLFLCMYALYIYFADSTFRKERAFGEVYI